MDPASPDGLLYLDDLHVGQRFTSGTRAVDVEGMTAFASQFDPQPFHLDEVAARDSLFGGMVASGWHTAAITMRLLVDGMPIGSGVIGAGGELSWPTATRAGDILHVESEILEITPSRSRPDRGMVLVRIETKKQDGALAQIFTVKMVVLRRPELAGPG